MKRIEVDFNNRGAGGTVRGSLRRAGAVKVNELVTIIDSEEGMEFEARVAEVDALGGRVLYAPLWERAGFEEALHHATRSAANAAGYQPATVGSSPRTYVKTPIPTSFAPGPFAMPRAV